MLSLSPKRTEVRFISIICPLARSTTETPQQESIESELGGTCAPKTYRGIQGSVRCPPQHLKQPWHEAIPSRSHLVPLSQLIFTAELPRLVSHSTRESILNVKRKRDFEDQSLPFQLNFVDREIIRNFSARVTHTAEPVHGGCSPRIGGNYWTLPRWKHLL